MQEGKTVDRHPLFSSLVAVAMAGSCGRTDGHTRNERKVRPVEWKNKRNWGRNTAELDRWCKAKRKSKAVLIICIFLFHPFFFLSLRMLHGGRVAKTIEGLKGRMEVCVCLKRANFRSPRSLFAWNRTNESKNDVSLVLMSTINKNYISCSTVGNLKRYWKQPIRFLSYLKLNYFTCYLL